MDSPLSFEIRAYEAILDTVVKIHSLEFNRYANEVRQALARLRKRSIIPAPLQEKMRNLKNSLSSISARISAHRRALTELLDEDNEMALMNLSKLKQKPDLYW